MYVYIYIYIYQIIVYRSIVHDAILHYAIIEPNIADDLCDGGADNERLPPDRLCAEPPVESPS